MKTKKFTIIFISLNVLLQLTVLYFLISYFTFTREITEQENMMVKINSSLDSLLGVKSDLLTLTEKNNEEIDRLRKIKENSFPEFAKRFIASLNSSAAYLENTEQNIVVSNIEGDKLYLNYIACNNLEYYKNKKVRIGKNQIYFYDLIYEFSDKGSEQGVTFFFRKDGAGNFKLYKMSIDGC